MLFISDAKRVEPFLSAYPLSRIRCGILYIFHQFKGWLTRGVQRSLAPLVHFNTRLASVGHGPISTYSGLVQYAIFIVL